MNIGRISLAILSVALLLTANLHVVYSVSVAGSELPGRYSAAQIQAGESAARAAAEEISRYSGECAGYEKYATVRFSPPDGDALSLALALLENSSGVDVAWRVSVDGEDLGKTTDPTALGEVLESILADRAVHDAVSAEFADTIALRRVFVPEGWEYDLMALSRALRDTTQVISITSDGTVRYS